MVLKRLLSRGKSEEEGEIDIESYLNDLSVRDGKIIEREDITYVKPIDLDAEGKGIGGVIQELEKNNVVILNVKELLHNKVLLREIVQEMKDTCTEMNGDIGRISPEKILLVPNGMRIVHRGGESME